MMNGVTLNSAFSGNPKLPEFVLWQTSDDVCYYHTGSYNRCIYEPGNIQSISDFSDIMAVVCLLSVCSHGLGRRFACKMG